MKKKKKPRQNYGKGQFGIGIFKPKTAENIGTLIRSAKMFGADYVFMIGERYKGQRSDVKLSKKIPIFYFEDYEQFKKSIPPTQTIDVIELVENSTPLSQFTHNQEAVYILGSEDKGVSKEILEDDKCRFIEIEGDSSLNVSVAGSIVLYDRFIKLNYKIL